MVMVHSLYRERGGEDAAFAAEARLLRSKGIPVEEVVFDNREIASASLLASAKLATATVWSRESASRLRAVLRARRPDLVHFHNTFPLVSPSAYAVCREEGVAVVQTLHNYRLFCANGVLFRQGRPCEDCLGRPVAWPSVRHGCYRHSRPQTAVVATLIGLQRLRRRWVNEIDAFVALTQFSRQKFLQAGLAPDRVVEKPNFVDPDPGEGLGPREGFLYVGRLDDFKGVRTLQRAWTVARPATSLRIAGEGPLESEVKRFADSTENVVFTGRLSRGAVVQEMHAAAALVFPSECYENFPMTIAEAFACGLPVIASAGGAMAEVVTHEKTGWLFAPGDAAALAETLQWAMSHPDQLARMGRNARREYELKYTAETNYVRLMAIYESVLSARREGTDAHR